MKFFFFFSTGISLTIYKIVIHILYNKINVKTIIINNNNNKWNKEQIISEIYTNIIQVSRLKCGKIIIEKMDYIKEIENIYFVIKHVCKKNCPINNQMTYFFSSF